jgi:hypothetical protein
MSIVTYCTYTRTYPNLTLEMVSHTNRFLPGQTGTFAETANVLYSLSFADQRKRTSVFRIYIF